MEIAKLVEIMKALRGQEGCPWDREQTRESLKPFLIEETYEVLEAIDEGDPEKIREELGDLLFQIIFHCQIATEREEFNINDVIKGISDKMLARHPHVFGKEKYETSEEVMDKWEEHKKREGKLKGSLLDGVPDGLPALLRAHRLQDRASRVGFDWDVVDDVITKLEEEVVEFKKALRDMKGPDIEDELGDIFFALVNISRFVGINPEDALRKTISKFIKRFRHIEITAADSGRTLSDMTLEEMDGLWESSKSDEKRS
ncbi:MAG: nucleoside triphosphate pyrophosphohydrolase [Nitrospirota bacterium]|nr:MAG: nucleoside triphosphate pyrophosphohydrolase [Nitrospirota bacterium]